VHIIAGGLSNFHDDLLGRTHRFNPSAVLNCTESDRLTGIAGDSSTEPGRIRENRGNITQMQQIMRMTIHKTRTRCNPLSLQCKQAAQPFCYFLMASEFGCGEYQHLQILSGQIGVLKMHEVTHDFQNDPP
jgi:hypothetical protein